VTPPPVQEFDPVAATAPSPPPASSPVAPSGGSPDAGSVAQEEFGP
jgi:hypothetical protein